MGAFQYVHCLVTGASGYLGSALVPALKAAGLHVTAQLRDGPAPVSADNVLRCELGEPALTEALAGVDVVVHLAAIAHQQASSADYQRVNVTATRDLARAALGSGVGRFLFVSSIKAALHDSLTPVRDSSGVCGSRGDDFSGADIHGQESGARIRNAASLPMDYSASKWIAEQNLAELCQGEDMELLVLRPALLYGAPLVGHLSWLRRWVDLRLPAPPAGGARAMVGRDDVVRLLVTLSQGSLPALRTLTVSDGERYSTARLHAALCACAGRKPLLPSPPVALWRLAAGALDRVRGEASGSTWLRLCGNEDLEASDLAELMDFYPQLNFERSLGLQG